MFPSRGDRDLGVAFQTHPGRQAFISSGSKEPRSALESRRLSLGAHWVDSRESSLLRRLERGRLSSCIWNLGFFPNDARKNCSFVLTAFTGWSSERCPGIGFLSRGDREIGVLRNVEPPTRT